MGTTQQQSSKTTNDVIMGSFETTPLLLMPQVADLEIDQERSELRLVETNSPFFSLKAAKKLARGKLLLQANADVLVDPRYVVKQTEDKVTIEIRAYAATYKNLRDATLTDFDEELERAKASLLKVSKPVELSVEKTRKAKPARTVLRLGGGLRLGTSAPSSLNSLVSGFGFDAGIERRVSSGLGFNIQGGFSSATTSRNLYPNAMVYASLINLTLGTDYYASVGPGELVVGLGGGLGAYSEVAFVGPEDNFIDRNEDQANLLLLRFHLGYSYPINDQLAAQALGGYIYTGVSSYQSFGLGVSYSL
jgi:hypothetical protein